MYYCIVVLDAIEAYKPFNIPQNWDRTPQLNHVNHVMGNIFCFVLYLSSTAARSNKRHIIMYTSTLTLLFTMITVVLTVVLTILTLYYFYSRCAPKRRYCLCPVGPVGPIRSGATFLLLKTGD